MIRWILAGAFGLCVALVPLYLVVGGAGSRDIWFHRTSTRRTLKKFDPLLAKYRKQHGSYPADLDALEFLRLDGWSHPFVYSLRGGKPLVESLGRDGVRGGNGMDADLSNQNPNPANARVPFLARIADPDARGMSLAALVCGLVAGFLFFSGLQNQNFEPRSWPGLAFSLVAALGLAIYGALFITVMHVPSGH